AQPRQRIIFAEERDHRTALARVTDDSGRDARDVLGDAESLARELSRMLGAGALLGIARLGHAPDPIAQRDQIGLLLLDQLPDIPMMIHALRPWVICELALRQ